MCACRSLAQEFVNDFKGVCESTWIFMHKGRHDAHKYKASQHPAELVQHCSYSGIIVMYLSVKMCEQHKPRTACMYMSSLVNKIVYLSQVLSERLLLPSYRCHNL